MTTLERCRCQELERFREILRRLDSLEAGQREFRAELAGMRSDLTHVALAVGARKKLNAG